jgi:DNA invertase Pin-like site-specific DNA recombinase
LERRAVVYIRQSSLKQVREHRESTTRQYALRERARRLGWSDNAIDVIDEDLGKSGSTTEGRAGFQRLAEDVARGRVGALFALEVSRLARSSADWYRLIDLAGLADVLIADEDVVYDPRDHNDRLLLGLKGQFAAAELYWLRLRLNGGLLAKARRGEVTFRLPTGYIWDDSERLVFDPDERVQRAIRLIFERFRLESSAYAVARYFQQHKLQMPLRHPATGELRWTAARYHWTLHVLRNPLYTGAYVYGRREQRAALVDGHVRHQRVRKLPMDAWQVCIRDHHPAYITWEEFVKNQKTLRDHCLGLRGSEPMVRGAAREGSALLQGLVLCGRCGSRMHALYAKPRYTFYVCDAAQKKLAVPGKCWSVSTRGVDQAVVDDFLTVVQPAEIDLSLAVARDAEKQAGEIGRQWQLQLEQARYAARLAERRYKVVDPDNRTVARTLEREWNEKLEDVAQLERAYDDVRRREKVIMNDADRHNILALARDLPKVWEAPTTTAGDRKNLLRMLIRDITLSPIEIPTRATRVQILWVTGATSEIVVQRSRSGVATQDKAVVEKVRELFEDRLSDREIAAQLTRLGLRPAKVSAWTAQVVQYLRTSYGIVDATKQQPLGRGGLYSTRGVARAIGIPVYRVRRWVRQGRLAPVEGGGRRPAWFRLSPGDIDRLSQGVHVAQRDPQDAGESALH